MVAPATGRGPGEAGAAPAFAAVRARLGLVGVLLLAAAAGWWWTARQMHGMDNGPWTTLGSLSWFLGIWVVMMAAMMLPSVSPTVALYSRMTRERSGMLSVLFLAGYLISWAGVGLTAYALAAGGRAVGDGVFAWDRGGRWIAGITLIVAAAYELTPLKDVCLGKCRSPLGFLLGAWRAGGGGALRMGVGHGAWCVGCCWALMASLFALGVMSVTWMAVLAGIVTIEKTLPWRRTATYGTAALLLCLGILVLAAPAAIPGFTVPAMPSARIGGM